MLAELVAVDEVLGVRHQIYRACLLEHGRAQRRDRGVLPTTRECLANFAGEGCRVLQGYIALVHPSAIIQLGHSH